MNGCESLRDDLKAYVDGELSPVRRAGVRLHLSRCAACREEMTTMEKIGSDLRAGDTGALDPSLKAKILAGVADVKPDPAAPIRDSFLRRNALPLWAGAAAVVVIWFVAYPGFIRQFDTGYERTVGAMRASVPRAAVKSQDVAKQVADAGGAASPAAPAQPTPILSQSAPVRIARAESQLKSKPMGVGAGGYIDAEGRVFPRAERPMAGSVETTDGHVKKLTEHYWQQPNLLAKAMKSGRYVKKEANITVEVDRLEEKSDAVEQMVKEVGGYVANNQLTTGEDGLKSASLTVKVPVPQFETMLSRFAKLGEVKAKNVTGEDITEQVSDEKQAQRALNDEMEEARQALAEARSRTQKRQATQDVKDLKVEIAQAEGRLELLKKEAALSTIQIELREKSKQPLPTGGGFLDDMGETGRAAVSSFVQAARLPVVLLIWVVAYAPVWIPLAIAYRFAMREHRRRVAARETRQWQTKWSGANPGPQA